MGLLWLVSRAGSQVVGVAAGRRIVMSADGDSHEAQRVTPEESLDFAASRDIETIDT